jgi:N-acetylmuramoyl-L-alanine amidase
MKPAAPDAAPARKERHPGKPIVVIDAGHGGVDPGATSVSGAYEKNIVLALAQDVKAALDKSGKVTAVLTRDRDIFIPLRERVAIARAANADLFMSLHADTVADPDIRGLSVYTLSQNASDAEAQALADKENKSDIVAGIDFSNESPEVTNILIDLVQRESMNLSAKFAGSVITEVSHDTHELLQNTHRFAGFAVLKAPDVPSVLVESGYLSNARDEQMLRRPEYRAKLAQALARAIEGFLTRQQKVRRS